MSAASDLASRLRTETREVHQRIEAAFDLLSPTLTRSDYRAHLACLHGFFRPLEERIASVDSWPARGIDIAARRRADLLAADLRTLGENAVEQLPICRDLPEIRDAAAALGTLYVLEGSTLGGQIVSRHLRDTLGITEHTGGRFFRGHGERTAGMWRSFCAALAAFADEGGDAERTVAAALATFRSLERWATRMNERYGSP